MLIFCDGFDCYSDSQILNKWDSSGGLIGSETFISASHGRNGTPGLRITPGFASVLYLHKNVPDQATYGLGVAHTVDSSAGSGPVYVFRFINNGTGHVDIYIRADGKIAADTEAAQPAAVSTLTVPFNQAVYIEAKVFVDNSTGTIRVKVDGVDYINATGLDTKANAVSAVINQIRLGSHRGGAFYANYDDFVIWDTTGSFCNDFLGDVRVDGKTPNANGATNNFTRGGSDSGANWSQVDEMPPNSDTDYVFSGTVTDKELYNFASWPASAVHAVAVNLFMKKTDASARSVRALAAEGGTEGDNGTDIPLSTSYTYHQAIFHTNPDSSPPAAWTPTQLNNAEFGVKVTV